MSAYVSVPCLLRCKPLTPRKSYGLVSKVYDEIDNKLNNPVVNVTTITVQSQVAKLFLWIQTKGILLSTHL